MEIRRCFRAACFRRTLTSFTVIGAPEMGGRQAAASMAARRLTEHRRNRKSPAPSARVEHTERKPPIRKNTLIFRSLLDQPSIRAARYTGDGWSSRGGGASTSLYGMTLRMSLSRNSYGPNCLAFFT
jgi:hypothetical protein